MLAPDTTVLTDRRTPLRVVRRLDGGAEGDAYEVLHVPSGEFGVLKTFRDVTRKDLRRERTRYLIGLDLEALSPTLHPPREFVDALPGGGHYARMAVGTTLRELLDGASPPLITALGAAVALAHSVDVVHARDVAHGDLHDANVRAEIRDGVIRIKLIDLDGFAAPGFPSPVAGAELYMAPEVRRAVDAGRAAPVSLAADRFALSLLIHEILLWVHPAVAPDGAGDVDATLRALSDGRWRFNSTLDRPANPGLPAEMLDPALRALFARGLGLDPAQRPTADEWKRALTRSLWEVWRCARCEAQVVIDDSKSACLFCGEPYPSLALETADGRRLDLGIVRTLGRDDLGGSRHVSARQATIRRHGPDYRISAMGINPTCRRNHATGAWIELPSDEAVLIHPGDVLRLADVEIRVVS
ncbi:MAG: hypothetical protein Q8S73_20370 [Deltaproteobacteria bacterium]|nr:hypothetical protein [Myxococcales bacterium]MDP3216475.1 hypothetical protein [Deltaproteobacteria bacterium]